MCTDCTTESQTIEWWCWLWCPWAFLFIFFLFIFNILFILMLLFSNAFHSSFICTVWKGQLKATQNRSVKAKIGVEDSALMGPRLLLGDQKPVWECSMFSEVLAKKWSPGSHCRWGQTSASYSALCLESSQFLSISRIRWSRSLVWRLYCLLIPSGVKPLLCRPADFLSLSFRTKIQDLHERIHRVAQGLHYLGLNRDQIINGSRTGLIT